MYGILPLVLKFVHACPSRPHIVGAGIVQMIIARVPRARVATTFLATWTKKTAGLCVVVRAEGVVVVGVRIVALLQKVLLRFVCAGRGGVETEVVAVLALFLELFGVAADDDDDVWKGEVISASRCALKRETSAYRQGMDRMAWPHPRIPVCHTLSWLGHHGMSSPRKRMMHGEMIMWKNTHRGR